MAQRQYHVQGNGIDRLVSILHPNTLSIMFRLDKTSILLVDTDNLVFLWNEELQKFDGIEAAKQPLTIEGLPLSVAPPQLAESTQAPFSSSSRVSFRAPAPPPFTVPGAAVVRNPPPANRFTYRPSQSQPETKTLIVHRASRLENGRPGAPLEMMHVILTREEANVRSINEKLQALPGFSNLVICNSRGVPFCDDTTTQKPDYWGFGRGAATNAKQYYALLPVNVFTEESGDDDDDEPHTSQRARKRSRKSLTKTDLKEISATLAKTLNSDLSKALKPLLMCYFCKSLAFVPICCNHCGKQVGCLSCVKQWLATTNESELDEFEHLEDEAANHKACPLCRGPWKALQSTSEWPKPNDLGYVKMIGFNDIISNFYS
uniref:RING-type domain-containing protein n=1 Tax=Plectus sambesii TaxID=2011161 RepID=A0A914VJR0_9BILA